MRKMPIQAGRRTAISASLLSLVIFWGEATLAPTPAGAQEKKSASETAAIEKKMARITIPSIELQDIPARTAIDVLWSKSMELDSVEADPEKKGVPFILPPEDSAILGNPKINLKLYDVPFVEALKYITALAQWKYEVKPDGVHLSPSSTNGDQPKSNADASKERKMDKSTAVTSDVFDKSGKKVPGLEFVKRRQQNYVLEFVGRPDEEAFQVTRHASSKYRRDTFVIRKGDESSDKMFRIDAYNESSALKQGIENDTSTLSITYLPDDRTFKLTRREKVTIPTYFAEFKVDGSGNTYVKKGDTFNLPGAPQINYKLIDVTEEKAVVQIAPE